MNWTSYANCCGSSHHFTHFGSWSGAAKIVHLKVAEQPPRTFFASSFPTTSTIATITTFHGHKWRTSTHTHAPPQWQHHGRTETTHRRARSTMCRPTERATFDGRDWAVGRGGEGRGTDGHWRPEKRVRNTMPRFAGLLGTWVHHHPWSWVEWRTILLSGPWAAHYLFLPEIIWLRPLLISRIWILYQY